MQGLMWKLTAAVALIAVSFMVLLQIQHGLELSKKVSGKDVDLEEYTVAPDPNANSNTDQTATTKVAGDEGQTKITQVTHNTTDSTPVKMKENPEGDAWNNKPIEINSGLHQDKFSNATTKITTAENPQNKDPWNSASNQQLPTQNPVNDPAHNNTAYTASNPWDINKQPTGIPQNQFANDADNQKDSSTGIVKVGMQSSGNTNTNEGFGGAPVGLFDDNVESKQPAGNTEVTNQFSNNQFPDSTNTNNLNNKGDAPQNWSMENFTEIPTKNSLKPIKEVSNQFTAEQPGTTATEKLNQFSNGSFPGGSFPGQNNTSQPPPVQTQVKPTGSESEFSFSMETPQNNSSGTESAEEKLPPIENNKFALEPVNQIDTDNKLPINSTPTFQNINNTPPPLENNNLKPIKENPFPLSQETNNTETLVNPTGTKPALTNNGTGNTGTNPIDLNGNAVVREGVPLKTMQPELLVEKNAPAKALLGEAMVYTITVKNIGRAPAKNVIIEDMIPKGSRLTGTIPRAQLVDKKLIWKYGQLDPNEAQTIKVRVIPTDEGEIGSVTTVSFKAEVAAETKITAPKLDIVLKHVEQAVVGENLLLTFDVRNVGAGDAAGVVLTSVLPPQIVHQVGKDLEYEIGTLPAGKNKEVKLAVQAADKGVAMLNAQVEAKGNIKANTKSNLEVIQSVLALTRKGPARRFVGRKAEYNMQLENLSVRDVTQVTLQEVVPAGMTFVSTTAGGAYDPKTRVVTWVIPQLKAKTNFPMKITLLAENTGDHQSMVQVADAAGNQASLKAMTRVEGFAQLGIREVNGKGPISIGEKASYSFHVANRGSASATQAKFVCTIPDGMSFVSAKGPVKYQQVNNQIVFESIASLKPNQEEQFNVVLVAKKQGELVLKIAVSADEMQTPVTHTEAVIVYQENY